MLSRIGVYGIRQNVGIENSRFNGRHRRCPGDAEAPWNLNGGRATRRLGKPGRPCRRHGLSQDAQGKHQPICLAAALPAGFVLRFVGRCQGPHQQLPSRDYYLSYAPLASLSRPPCRPRTQQRGNPGHGISYLLGPFFTIQVFTQRCPASAATLQKPVRLGFERKQGSLKRAK